MGLTWAILAQTQFKETVLLSPRCCKQHQKPLIAVRFLPRLERPCGKRDNLARLGRPEWRLATPGQAVAMTDEEERALREQLARLQQEHRDLDAAIAALAASPGSDLIQVQRLKKRKLVLRDKIRIIEDQLTPDIIA
jgi:hypothetical protein